MSLTVTIVGRPNVGKSTLFNRLAGKRMALVHDKPGVTRDVREARVRFFDLDFTLLDTAGFEEIERDQLAHSVRDFTLGAVDRADLCLLLIDARAGVTQVDRTFANMLRRSNKKVILCSNKAEGRLGEAYALEGHELGFGDPIVLSAEHGIGLDDLRSAIAPYFVAASASHIADTEAKEAQERALQIALLGRPNSGKSTLVNSLLGEERMLTGSEAGITRDAIASEFVWGGRTTRLFDTAGLRKKARIIVPEEKLAAEDALRAARFAEIVIMLIDACFPFEAQDLRLLNIAESEGRAVVVAVNKWDLIKEKAGYAKKMREELDRLVPRLAGTPIVPVSALHKSGLEELKDAVFSAEKQWCRRISTGKLNRWLAQKINSHSPPAVSGRRLRLRYMTQVKSRPPTFALFCSRPSALPQAYLRYLENGLRQHFALQGTPIRFILRKSDNPYI